MNSIEDWLMNIGLTILTLIFVAITFGLVSSTERDAKLMEECMLDHKEYECVGIIHGRQR